MIKNIKLFLLKLFHFSSELRWHYFYSEISKIKRCDVLLFCHDVNRSLTLNYLAYSPLIDPIYEEFKNENIECQLISLPWSRLGLKKTQNKSLLFNRDYLIQLMKNKIFKSKNFQAYELIFRETKARLIIGIGLPSDLCLTAQKYNITTVELLHGIGYTFIPWGWDKLTSSELPKKILVFDDVSRETFKPLELRGLSVIKVRHPFYKNFLNPKYVKPVEWNYPKMQNGQNILVTLQHGYDGEQDELIGILNNGIFYEELEELIKKRSDFFWHFRLHPVQMKGPKSNEVISFMRNFSFTYKNVIWEKSSTAPLLSVAAVCDVHITMNSMSCYDVAMLGLPSLILCPTTRDNGIYGDYFADLVSEGYAIKAQAKTDFIEVWIDNAKRKEPRSLGVCDGDPWGNLISEVKSGV